MDGRRCPDLINPFIKMGLPDLLSGHYNTVKQMRFVSDGHIELPFSLADVSIEQGKIEVG